MPIRELDTAWVAGFVDGEGTICIPTGAGSNTPVVQLVQSGDRGKEVLDRIKEWIGGSAKVYPHHSMSPLTRKKIWILLVSKRSSSVPLIKKLLPFLQIKRTECQDVLRFCKLFPSLHGKTSAETKRARRVK